jgi:hypothetical protein
MPLKVKKKPNCALLSKINKITPLNNLLCLTGGVARNLESGPPKDHFNSNFRAKDLDVIFIS